MDDKNEKNKHDKVNSDQEENSSRRHFIKNAGIFTGGIIGAGFLGGALGNKWGEGTDSETETKTTPDFSEARIFFNRREDFNVLSWATERILPEDDSGPGAILLGVPYFIDKQLAGSWGKNDDGYMMGPFKEGEPTQGVQSPLNRGEIFIQGLRKINQVSQKEFDNTFGEIEEDQQIEILTMFENGDVELKDVDSTTFFDLLKQGTLEGAYSDPLYGGNRNMDGWRMKEYPGPQSSYINQIEKEDFVLMDPISLSDYNK